MDIQFFITILIGFGILVIILFGIDIYQLTKKSKEEKGVMSLKFSETFLIELEKIINQEVKKTISNTSEKINDKIAQSFEKQATSLFEKAEEKLFSHSEEIKNQSLKFNNACSSAEQLVIKQAEKVTEQLAQSLDQKIDQVYQAATKSISQKIDQTEKNIDNYKKEKLNEIDQKIFQMIEDVAKKTIGKSIDLSLHEELVIQALEKAKKENFL
jgi:membrane-associated HD superfamily phosphohydrolase